MEIKRKNQDSFAFLYSFILVISDGSFLETSCNIFLSTAIITAKENKTGCCSNKYFSPFCQSNSLFEEQLVIIISLHLLSWFNSDEVFVLNDALQWQIFTFLD